MSGPGSDAAPTAVREATDEDMPAIVGIYVRAYAQPPWNERHNAIASEGYLNWVRGVPDTRCLVTTDAMGRVTGFVLAGQRPYEEFVTDWERLAERPPRGWPLLPGRLGYIWEIAVDPPDQRRGYGAALMAGALELLRGEGVDTVVLRSSEQATAAISLYRRFGFQRLAVRERLDPLSGPWTLSIGERPIGTADERR